MTFYTRDDIYDYIVQGQADVVMMYDVIIYIKSMEKLTFKNTIKQMSNNT